MERLRSLEMLEAIINRSRAMVFLWRFNEEFPVDYVSDNVRLLGYEPEDFYSGRVSWPRITFTGDEPRLRAEVERYLALGVDSWSQEYRLYDKAGDLRWVEDHNRVIRDDTGAITHIQGIVLDVSERKQIELGLEAAWSTFHSIVQRSHEGVIVLDARGRVLFLNEAAQVMLGKSLAEITGEPFPLAFELGASMEVAIHRLGGLTGVGELRSQPTHWHGQTATLVTVVDVTEQLQAEREVELQRARNLRIDRLTALGEMAGSIAHEINQPLTGIRGIAEHLRLGLERDWEMAPEQMSEQLGRILQQTDRMERVVQHVRQFAHEPSRVKRSALDVNAVVNAALYLIRTQITDRGYEIVETLEENLPPVIANNFALEEVVLNFITNARDALQERAEQGEDGDWTGRIRVVTGRQNEEVCIEVYDNGIGLGGADLGMLFEPFYTTKPPMRGTGLGLVISKRIAEEFGGKIAIEKAASGETMARLCLPAAAGGLSNGAV